MFSLGNILFKVIFQNYRFWGRFLFVKTFSPRILRQMAQVLGSPEKKIHPDFMSFPETHVMAAKPPWLGLPTNMFRTFWKGFPWASVDIFVGVFPALKGESTPSLMMKTRQNPSHFNHFIILGEGGGGVELQNSCKATVVGFIVFWIIHLFWWRFPFLKNILKWLETTTQVKLVDRIPLITGNPSAVSMSSGHIDGTV